jgi:hypothetical protein
MYDVFARLRWGSSAVLPAGVFLLAGLLISSVAHASAIFINEIHYDNVGGDSGEGVEIAGPAGTDLTGWSLAFYNGSNGKNYLSEALSGFIPDRQNGYGTLFFERSGIQNGSADGLALLDPTALVVQFFSYEGELTAINGAAAGMTSTDIGVAESSSSPSGFSLQLAGFGSLSEDFFWTQAKLNSFGAINPGQGFSAQAPVPTPEPSTLLLFGVAGAALLLRKRLTS